MEITKGLVVLSADPITNGHIHFIETAQRQCTELIVLVANNDNKKGSYLFSLDERTAMTKRALRHLNGVHVMSSDGLLVDAFVEYECDVLFRGIRNEADRRYEEEQMIYHAMIYPPIASRVVYLPSAPEFAHISSTLLKAFVSHHVDISKMAPIYVKQMMEERMHGQFRLGITSELAIDIGSFSWALYEKAQQRGIQTHMISLDALSEQHGIEQIDRFFRSAIRGKKGLILIEWTANIGRQVSHWTNHHVVLAESFEGRLDDLIHEIQTNLFPHLEVS